MPAPLAYETDCRTCGVPIYVAICTDGFYRGFDKYELPAGSDGSWAWRKRRGMSETDLVPGHPLHHCLGHHRPEAPTHEEYAYQGEFDDVAPPRIRPAPPPSRPIEVVQGPFGGGWRWICAGCGRLARGEAAYVEANRWFCHECVDSGAHTS